jgi:pseudouridine synthase
MAEERLQNVLAKAGISSRRGAAAIIESGRVTVDGIVVTVPGTRVDAEMSSVCVDGRRVGAAEKKRTIMMYKPVGVLSSMSDPFGGKTVADLIRGQIAERVVPVGRLDKDSEGLLLMSNDGDLTLKLTHPRYDHEKTYEVKVAGRWSDEKLRILRSSVVMPDGYAIRPVPVKVLETGFDNVHRLSFRLHEGRKRQIRYMCSAAHLVVLSLKRVAIGSLRLPDDMKSGEWRDVSEKEINELLH